MTSARCQVALYAAALVADVALLTDILGAGVVVTGAVLAMFGALAVGEGI